MAWIYLLIASGLEVVWAIGLKYTHGFTAVVPTILVAAAIIGSFVLIALAIREIPLGTAYAVFAGIGAGGTGLLGILVFDEPAGTLRLISLAAIVCGVVGLKAFSAVVMKSDNAPARPPAD